MAAVKALVLFSGGLDSMLAVKMLESQGIEADGVCFTSAFFGAGQARRSAEQIGIRLMEISISREMAELVKNPPSGYGKNLNPCLDCHALMISRAGEFLKIPPAPFAQGGDFDFVATGEVLGQRPFSQNRKSLKRVEKLSGIEVLRPLSAKLLDETEIEKSGLVRRGRLGNICGRGRQAQMELADKFKIREFPSPAGGCLLTDPAYSQRLLELMENWPDFNDNDAELLKNGRVFWMRLRGPGSEKKKSLLIIGRNSDDNDRLAGLARNGDIMLKLKEGTGPLALARKFRPDREIGGREQEIICQIPQSLKKSELRLDEEKSFGETIGIAGILTGYYSTKARGNYQKITYKTYVQHNRE